MTEFIDPQPTPEFSVTVTEPIVAPPAPDKPALIAPLWHTLLITALILGNSFLGSSKVGAVKGSGSRILLYGGTFVTQLILILLIWFGIRLRGVRMRDLIGGRWKTVEAFLLDVGSGRRVLVYVVIASLRDSRCPGHHRSPQHAEIGRRYRAPSGPHGSPHLS